MLLGAVKWLLKVIARGLCNIDSCFYTIKSSGNSIVSCDSEFVQCISINYPIHYLCQHLLFHWFNLTREH